MKTQRLVGLALCLAAALAVGQFAAGGKTPGLPQAARTQTDPAQGNGKRAQAFIDAFNKGDAKAVAAFWTPDGDYIDEAGKQIKGRAAIEKLYDKVFAAMKGAKLTVTVTSTKMVGTDVLLEDGISEVTPANGDPTTSTRFSAVLVKKAGEWYFESVRESLASPPSNGEHLEDLAWLIGDWKGEADKGESGTASYSWAENQNFIVSEFATTLNGIPVVGGTQWIGWDAVDMRIRSWSFYSGGGFGEAAWTKDGGNWVTKVTARTAEGKKVAATNTLTRVDADHLTSQISQLTVDGQTDARPAGDETQTRQTVNRAQFYFSERTDHSPSSGDHSDVEQDSRTRDRGGPDGFADANGGRCLRRGPLWLHPRRRGRGLPCRVHERIRRLRP